MERSDKINLFYLISGRSAVERTIGRKIPSVVASFSSSAKVKLICGGDLEGGIAYDISSINNIPTNADYYKKWYRKLSVLDFFTRTLSEVKDIYHNKSSYKYLLNIDTVPDLVWERSSRLHYAGLKYAKKKGIPCVLEWKDHLIPYKYSLLKPYALYIESKKNKIADYVVVESFELKKRLSESGVDAEKIHVAYNAVDPDEFVKSVDSNLLIRNKYGFRETDMIIGYVGSYAFYHDSIRMIKAADILNKRGLEQVKFLLVGSGKDYNICHSLAEEKGLLGKNIFMVPQVPKEDVPMYLSAMDVTLLPGSTDIICPIKVMEYMAAKSVVMVPDYACNREVINQENGILFTPFSEKDIADKIEQLCGDPGKRFDLGENARKTVIEKFTWNKTYGRVLTDILGKIERGK